MYALVGRYDNPRRLADLAHRLNPQPSREGYGTTASEATIALYKPLLADTFQGEWTYSILAVIWPNGSIPPHCDGDTITQHSRRFHLVLQSNGNSWSMHDGKWQQLEEGGIYTFDPSLVHASINWGKEPRIHLVVDTR